MQAVYSISILPPTLKNQQVNYTLLSIFYDELHVANSVHNFYFKNECHPSQVPVNKFVQFCKYQLLYKVVRVRTC